METFTALADPTRRRIVELLAHREMAAGDIVQHFETSASAVSQHLKVLRAARLVRVRPEAQRRLYSLDPKGLEEIDVWLSSVRRFWNHRLDALEKQLEKARRAKREEKKE